MTIYLVGGAVRDMLLGRVPVEFDYAFAGDIASFAAAHPGAKIVGKSVKGLIFQGMDFMPLRGGAIEKDLAGRDFTINALALEENGVIRAHPLAFADLKNGVLRPTAPGALAADPLRVFRAARFAAQLPDFTAHAQCLEQMREVAAAGRLAAIPAERVGRELLKALQAPAPARFFRLLAATGCLEPWFAEMEAARHVPAGPAPWHDNSVFEHTCDIMEALASGLSDEELKQTRAMAVWLGLTHDLGKVDSPREILPHHYGHELRGAAAAAALAARLALPKRMGRAGALAARQHMKAGQYPRLRPGSRCDLLMSAHDAGLSLPFWRLADADSGRDVSGAALADLETILSVSLPEEWRNRGAESSARLRAMRCERLARAIR